MFHHVAVVSSAERRCLSHQVPGRLSTRSLVLAVALCAQLTALVGLAAPPAARPNLLIIVADDMGYSDLGCYGGEIETPNLDALAQSGLRFTQFYNTARCWPTRAALLTGYYAQQVRRDTVPGIAKTGGAGTRPAWAALLPEMLKPYGYRTYHSGKWHVDGEPVANGFDHSYLLPDQDRLFSPPHHSLDGKALPPVARGSGYYATTAIGDHAVQCLREHAAKYAGQPFFHYVAFVAPHFPLQALPQDIARYRDTYTAGWEQVRARRFQRLREMGIVQCELSTPERDVGPPYDFPDALAQLGPGEVNRPLPWDALTDEQRAFQASKMAIHAAMVYRNDQEIGRIVQQLREMDALDNTLILFLSDNGASAEIMVRGDGHDPNAPPGSAATFLCLGPGWSTCSNTPFRRHKTWVHEGGISTPLIVHWPQGITTPGALRHNPGHVIDIVPTVLDAAGIAPPTSWHDLPVPAPPGKSLLPAFATDHCVTHECLWWLHEDNRAIRVGNWKLVADNRQRQWELYDLDKDRAESVNLAAEYPDKVRELQELWEQQWREIRELAAQDLPK